MTSTAANVVITVAGLFFLGMGLYALAAPERLLRPFGTELGAASARAEVRAVYGGFGVAMAAVLGVAVAQGGLLRTGVVVTVGAALAGMAFGRVVAGLLGERTSFYPNWFYCLVEIIGAGALFLAR